MWLTVLWQTRLLKLSDSTEVVDIQSVANLIEVESFPIDDFFRVPFTHHMLIAKAAKQKEERYYYIHRAAEENLSVSSLKQLIKEDAYGHQGQMPNNFAVTISDAAQARKAVMMFKDEYLLNFINVEEIGERDALPDEVALRKVLCGGEE